MNGLAKESQKFAAQQVLARFAIRRVTRRT